MAKIKRWWIQFIATITTNSYFTGFLRGKIYTGKSKQFCVPGLNCYSCPGAIGSCPIGSLQAVIGSIRFKFSFYILGIISLLGVLFGRIICGWLCPFGFVQELLHKIPVPKIKIKKEVHNCLKYLKYAVFLIFVILLPLVLVDEFGMSEPYFCKLLCPAGTLEGGIPLVLLNKSLRELVGILFAWKLSVLLLLLFLSMILFRPFCKYLCPLGAVYGLFNSISFSKMEVDKDACTSCGRCIKTCKMNVNILKDINSNECIRCGECMKACKKNAISYKLDFTAKHNGDKECSIGS